MAQPNCDFDDHEPYKDSDEAVHPGLDVRKTLVYAEHIETLMVMRRDVSPKTLELTMLAPWAAKPGGIKTMPCQPINPFSSRGCANARDAANLPGTGLLMRPNQNQLSLLSRRRDDTWCVSWSIAVYLPPRLDQPTTVRNGSKDRPSSLGGGGCAARRGAIYQDDYPERVILEH